MAEPVLRIPIDDTAFQRYMEAFNRYQQQLRDQPEMWSDTNAEVLQGVTTNLALADAIGEAVSAAVRLGDAERRNEQGRRKAAQDETADEIRAAGWRRKALDHVQELSRSSSTVVRSFGSIAGGTKGAGGLLGMIADGGKSLGGDIGALIGLVGHTLNAGYEANAAVSDKGLFARGIGATLGQQEGFHNNLGRYTNTDQGIDAVMNARGSPDQWWQFNALGVKGIQSDKSNAEVYGDVLRKQVELAKRYTTNGVTNYAAIDPRGATAFGTTHEDLNRLKGLSGADLDKAIKDAVSFKTPLQDKQIDAATKSTIAADNLATRVVDNTQMLAVGMAPALDKTVEGLNRLTDVAGKIYEQLSGANKSVVPPAARSFLDTIESPLKKLLGPGMSWLFDSGPGGAPAAGAAGGSGGAARGGGRSGAPAVGGGRGPADAGLLAQAKSMVEAMGGRVTSTQRSYAEQKRLYDKYQTYKRGGPWAALAAAPGHSAHESGQALDVAYGKGISLAGITAQLKKIGINVTRALNEGDHYHVEWSNPARQGPRGGRGATSSNTHVSVKVSAPPGHQTAVTANTAVRG